MAPKVALFLVTAAAIVLSACGSAPGGGSDSSPTAKASQGSPSPSAAESALPTPPASVRPTSTNRPPEGVPGPPMEEVDAGQYRTSQGYYFVSENKDIYCAISTNPSMDAMKVGCQATFTVAQLPECATPASSAPAAWIGADAGQPVTKKCVNQGFFVGENPKVLTPGKMIKVDGYTCGALIDWQDNTTPIYCENGTRRFTLKKGELK